MPPTHSHSPPICLPPAELDVMPPALPPVTLRPPTQGQQEEPVDLLHSFPGDPLSPRPFNHRPQRPSSVASPRSAGSRPSWGATPRSIFRSAGVRPSKEDAIKRLPRVRRGFLTRAWNACQQACCGCADLRCPNATCLSPSLVPAAPVSSFCPGMRPISWHCGLLPSRRWWPSTTSCGGGSPPTPLPGAPPPPPSPRRPAPAPPSCWAGCGARRRRPSHGPSARSTGHQGGGAQAPLRQRWAPLAQLCLLAWDAEPAFSSAGS